VTAKSLTLSRIVAVDGSSESACPLVTFQFRPDGAPRIGRPQLVTMSLCEWQRVAQQIVEARSALHC
jgi:hypothetical protein